MSGPVSWVGLGACLLLPLPRANSQVDVGVSSFATMSSSNWQWGTSSELGQAQWVLPQQLKSLATPWLREAKGYAWDLSSRAK